MRILLCLALAGCAMPGVEGPKTFDTSREPRCTRECLASYSTCVSGTGRGDNRLVANDILLACQGNTNACLATCPAK